MCRLSPIRRESIPELDSASVLCYHMIARQGKSTPSKEVGHDKERSLVMPMGISQSELSGNVRGEVASIGKLGCSRAHGSPELFVCKARLPEGGNGSSAVR
jgi:hypothetical protein